MNSLSRFDGSLVEYFLAIWFINEFPVGKISGLENRMIDAQSCDIREATDDDDFRLNQSVRQ